MAFLTGDVNIICGMINNTQIGNNVPSTGTFTNILTDGLEINDLGGTDKYIFGVSNLSSDVTVTLPALITSDTFVFENFNQTLTNKTITDSTNVVTASNLKTTGGDVNISISSPPELDQVLQATTPTIAIWQHLPNRRSVRVATTIPGTLSTDYNVGDVIDGVTLVLGDRILIKNQASSVENGIYTVNAIGNPSRALDYAIGDSVASTFMFIQEGIMNGDTGWLCTNNTGTDIIDTDGLVFIQFTSSSNKLATYPLSTFQISANTPSYTTIAYFPWINALYSSYTSGRLLFRATVTNRTLDIRIRDVTNSVTLGSSLGIAVSGFFNIPVINPISNAQLELQVRKSGPGGGNPQILGVILEFNC